MLEKVITELVARGRRVATVKHHSHVGFEIDREGKDIWRMARAGSRHVVIAAPDKIAAYRSLDRELTLPEILATITDTDIVLVEGYRDAEVPHIEVIRGAGGFLGAPERRLAVVTEQPIDAGVPVFGFDDVAPLVEFLETVVATRPNA